MLLYFFYFISFCDSLFYGSVSFSLYFFYFVFLLFPFLWSVSFSLYLFSLFCSLLFLFYLGGSIVLVQVKQVRGVLQSFYYKNSGRGEFVHKGCIHKKENE